MSVLPFPTHEPVDFFTPELMIWWTEAWPIARDLLLKPQYRRKTSYSDQSGNLLIYPPDFYIKENKVNGRKPKGDGTKSGVSDKQHLPFRWINSPLTSEDYDYLEQQATSLELLASHLIQLVLRGFGVSVKYDYTRKSYNVCIYRPDNSDGRQPLGLSGHSSDLRDAILVTLYRFSIKLGGEFPDRVDEDTSDKPRRRFG
jgi:hypothetical protein